jgi:hypothetical protein
MEEFQPAVENPTVVMYFNFHDAITKIIIGNPLAPALLSALKIISGVTAAVREGRDQVGSYNLLTSRHRRR